MATGRRLPQILALVALTLVVLAACVASNTPGLELQSQSQSAGRPSAYAEQVVELPGFDPLYGYVYGSNCEPGFGGCYLGGSDYSQVPVLSSDSGQPFGIYYVNNESELVERELPSETIRTVAHVTLLYQTYALYGGMLANEFFLPYGEDEALFFGTLDSYSYYVSVETVNLTTGVVHLVNTMIPVAAANQQPLLVDPNDVFVISSYAGGCTACMAVLTGVNMTTGREWYAGALPYFEANNVYWLPQKHQLIDVEAHGANGDQVSQWNESRNAYGNLTFAFATDVVVDTGVVVNWVNGLGYNSTADKIAYAAGGPALSATYVLGYNSNGTLTARGEQRYVSSINGSETDGQVLNGQQYVYTSTWVMGGFYNGTQFLFDPWNGTAAPTNEPFTDLVLFDVCDASCFLGTYGPSIDYLIDFHASVARNDPFWSVVVAFPSPEAALWP